MSFDILRAEVISWLGKAGSEMIANLPARDFSKPFREHPSQAGEVPGSVLVLDFWRYLAGWQRETG